MLTLASVSRTLEMSAFLYIPPVGYGPHSTYLLLYLYQVINYISYSFQTVVSQREIQGYCEPGL